MAPVGAQSGSGPFWTVDLRALVHWCAGADGWRGGGENRAAATLKIANRYHNRYCRKG